MNMLQDPIGWAIGALIALGGGFFAMLNMQCVMPLLLPRSVTCSKCGFVLDVASPLTCELPDCHDALCPLDRCKGRPEGSR